jgi:hypothetical protein
VTIGGIVLVSLRRAFSGSELPEVDLPQVPPPFLPFLGSIGAIVVALVSLRRPFLCTFSAIFDS